jgi:hypothetical protein
VQWSRIMQWAHVSTNPLYDFNPSLDPRSYNPVDVMPEEFKVTEAFGDRVAEFFDIFYKTWRSPSEQLRLPVNCHRFARWMVRDRLALKPQGRDSQCELINKMVVATQPLPLGIRGIIGKKDETKYGINTMLHSVIGLGTDIPDCLQVMAQDGFMGLDGYKKLIDEYRHDNDQDIDLYAPRPNPLRSLIGRLAI